MYRKKATFITFNSITALPKVCRYPNSHSSIKILTLLRNFGIAAERSDFDNPSGTNREHSINYERNPNGFYRNDNEQGGNWNLGGNNGHFQENPDGFYGENGIGNGVYQQKPTRVYEKKPIYEMQQSPVEDNVIFPTNNDNNNSRHASRKGFQPNPDVRIGNLMSRNEFRDSSAGQNVNPWREVLKVFNQIKVQFIRDKVGKLGISQMSIPERTIEMSLSNAQTGEV